LFISFLLGALDDRPRLKRNVSERVRKNQLQAHFFCRRFSSASNTRRLANHIKPRKLRITDKAAELVGHLASVEKVDNII
jgi:hypothetical protein